MFFDRRLYFEIVHSQSVWWNGNYLFSLRTLTRITIHQSQWHIDFKCENILPICINKIDGNVFCDKYFYWKKSNCKFLGYRIGFRYFYWLKFDIQWTNISMSFSAFVKLLTYNKKLFKCSKSTDITSRF